MALEEDSNAAMARLLKSVLLVETELDSVIQRFQETSYTSIETKSGEAGALWGCIHCSYFFFIFYSKLVIPLVVASDDDGVGKNPIIQRKEQVGTLKSYSPPTGGGEIFASAAKQIDYFSRLFPLSSFGLLKSDACIIEI